MKLTPTQELSTAISITSEAFNDDLDKGGEPYILHCLHVMNVVGKKTNGDHQIMAIGVLHDLIEDKEEWSIEELSNLGFSDRVIVGVATMTHSKSEPYMDYIKRVARNPDTVIVKMADLDHNSKITRIKGVSTKDIKRIEKYHRAFIYLKEYGVK